MRQTFTKVAPLGGAVLFLLAVWGSVPSSAAPARPGPIVVEIGDRYGPVAPTEALWSIANRLRPEGAVTVQQMMMALLRANPDAFFHDNVNWLKRGRTLRLPAASELQALSAREALLAIKSQNDRWRAAGGVLPGVEPERLAAPSADLVEAAAAASPEPVATAEAAPEQASAADAGLTPPARSEGGQGASGESTQGPAEDASLPQAGGAAPTADPQDPPPAAPVRKENPVPVVASKPAKTAAKEQGEIRAWIATKTIALARSVSEFTQDWLPEEVWTKWSLDELEENLQLQENLAASVVLAGLVLFLLLLLWWLWPRRHSADHRNAPKITVPAPGIAMGQRRPAGQRAKRRAPPSQSEAATEADDIARNKLDLAKAYSALGDKEQARAALQEVLAEGNPAQQKEARELLAQLGQ